MAAVPHRGRLAGAVVSVNGKGASSSHSLTDAKKGPTRGNQAHTLKELWPSRGALGQELCWGAQVI